MSAQHEWSRIAALVWKDVTTEWRAKASFNSVVFLAGLILLLFGFALGPDQAAVEGAGAGIIWLTLLFSGVLTFNRCYERELDDGALEVLLLYPGGRRSIFVGKVVSNLAFLLLVGLLILPAAAFLYNLAIFEALLPLALVLVLGMVGFVTLGTFYAAMASRLRAREVLLPLLLFPMLIPMLVAAVEATGALLGGDVMGRSGGWIRLLIVFDAVFVAASLLAFEYVIEE
jgi:heme exporter protein B